MIDQMLQSARSTVAKRGGVLEIDAAREGTEIVLG
jgi:hypothetical protein